MLNVSLQELADDAAIVHFEAQAQLSARLGDANWDVDLDGPAITYSTRPAPTVLPAQLIGSVAQSAGTWMWGWNNVNSFPSQAVALAGRVRHFVAGGGPEPLTAAVVRTSETPTLLLLLAAKALTRSRDSVVVEAAPGVQVHLMVEASQDAPPTAEQAAAAILAAVESGVLSDHERALHAYSARASARLRQVSELTYELEVSDGTVEVTLDARRRIVVARVSPVLEAPGTETAAVIDAGDEVPVVVPLVVLEKQPAAAEESRDDDAGAAGADAHGAQADADEVLKPEHSSETPRISTLLDADETADSAETPVRAPVPPAIPVTLPEAAPDQAPAAGAPVPFTPQPEVAGPAHTEAPAPAAAWGVPARSDGASPQDGAVAAPGEQTETQRPGQPWQPFDASPSWQRGDAGAPLTDPSVPPPVPAPAPGEGADRAFLPPHLTQQPQQPQHGQPGFGQMPPGSSGAPQFQQPPFSGQQRPPQQAFGSPQQAFGSPQHWQQGAPGQQPQRGQWPNQQPNPHWSAPGAAQPGQQHPHQGQGYPGQHQGQWQPNQPSPNQPYPGQQSQRFPAPGQHPGQWQSNQQWQPNQPQQQRPQAPQQFSPPPQQGQQGQQWNQNSGQGPSHHQNPPQQSFPAPQPGQWPQPGHFPYPAQPGRPQFPGQPQFPAQPQQPYPARPDQPQQPYPGQPYPGMPPQQPAPGQPVPPSYPGQPNHPAAPGHPDYPGQPGTPAQPQRPVEPAQPEEPEDPNAWWQRQPPHTPGR